MAKNLLIHPRPDFNHQGIAGENDHVIAGESSTRMAGRGGTSTSTFGATRKPDAREDFGNVGQSYTRTPMGMSSATAGKQRTGPLCGAWG